MSHLDPDKSPDWNDDIDAFEQQLRVLRPSPPARTWSSIAESIERSRAQPMPASSMRPATSVLRSAVSHALTAVAGLAVGVGLMLTQQPNKSATTGAIETAEKSSAGGIDIASGQPTAQQHHSDSVHETTAEASTAGTDLQAGQIQSEPRWRSHRFRYTNLNDANRNGGPLTVFGSIDTRLVHSKVWQKQAGMNELSQPEDSDGDDNSLDQPDNLPVDRPVLSPRSLQLFLNDLTCVPSSKKPFCNSEDSRS